MSSRSDQNLPQGGSELASASVTPKMSAVVFSRASDEWRTPEALFVELDAEFGFDLDVAATAENCWKENYIGPDRRRPDRTDALECHWRWLASSQKPAVCWCNPPYSKVGAFVEKAASEARDGATVVMLLPSRTDTKYWHRFIWDAEKHQPRPGVEIRFIKGRLKFGNSQNSAPFPSVVIVFRPPTGAA
jgi:phage N-6-adenine-methyltransferase